jgi:hypothetical protein
MKILFLDDCNMHEGHNPLAMLVELSDYIECEELYNIESQQIGATRMGGNWKQLLIDLEKQRGITYTILKKGKRSDIEHPWKYWTYRMISGNY